MPDVSPECAPKRTFADASEFHDFTLWMSRLCQPALSRTPARKNFCGSTASPSIRVS
jgi:hypothetical protein